MSEAPRAPSQPDAMVSADKSPSIWKIVPTLSDLELTLLMMLAADYQVALAFA